MATYTSVLINKGINLLKSYFDEEPEKDLIGKKITNISSKTGKYFVPSTLFQKRTPRKNRALIPFEHVVQSGLSYEALDSFEGGVVVEFVNNEYFQEASKDESQQHPIFRALKNKLGSDDNVSAMIDIRSTGSSSSSVQRKAYENLMAFLEKRGQKEEDVLITRKPGVSGHGVGSGNEKWKGFVYYSIRGGQQDVNDSHKKYGIESKSVQLFNPSVEYASADVSADITLVLTYFAFYAVPLKKRNKDWRNLVEEYREYFNKQTYLGINLLEHVDNHITINIIKDQLIDPIQARPIHLEDFIKKERTDDALDIAHQDSVKKHSYVWDSERKTVLTPANPTNLFWSTHLSNMMQQNYSLKEYFPHQRSIIREWDKLGIEDFLGL